MRWPDTDTLAWLKPDPDLATAHRTMTMRWLNQTAELTLITLWTIPQRLGTSLVIVIGIAGVVGVLVSVLAMSEGFRHTLASTGRQDRVIILRAGSDAELSSGLERDQVSLVAPLRGVRRDPEGHPLASAELMVMVDLPRKGQTDPNNVPFRGAASRPSRSATSSDGQWAALRAGGCAR